LLRNSVNAAGRAHWSPVGKTEHIRVTEPDAAHVILQL
jgi:hypothetical protein